VVVLVRIESGEADVRIAEEVELGVEPVIDRAADRREGLPALVATELLELGQRVDARSRHVGIVLQILLDIELRRGVTSLLPAELIEVLQRIEAGGPHVGVGRKVAVGAELGIRVAPFLETDAVVVRVGVSPGVPDILVVRIVEQIVHQRAAIIEMDGAVGELEVLDSLHLVAAFGADDENLAALEHDIDGVEVDIEHRRVLARAADQRIVTRAAFQRQRH
jgi:hypothetical protein